MSYFNINYIEPLQTNVNSQQLLQQLLVTTVLSFCFKVLLANLAYKEFSYFSSNGSRNTIVVVVGE